MHHLTKSKAVQRFAPRQFSTLVKSSRSIRHRNPALSSTTCGSQIRRFNLHEYQSLTLFSKYDVPTPEFTVAYTPGEAEVAAEKIKKSKGAEKVDFVVKAQVLAGGRGKGTFQDGFQGGVHPANSPLEVRGISNKMLNNRLVTNQTGPEGKPCDKVLVTERLYLRSESYFAILMDRESGGPVMVGSSEGGMDIEAVAARTPHLIHKIPVNIGEEPNKEEVAELAKKMGFDTPSCIEQATNAMCNLYKLFLETDATLVEINPLVETHDGKVLLLDAKLNFDDNASYRQKELHAMQDPAQEDPREVAAAKHDLNYIGLDGSIGCLVNGAGLAMATMDAIELNGGSPANFLDVGGGASATQVTEAMKILNGDPNVRAILVNIFGGIMRCDVIALGLISAATTLGLKKPIVVRLAGTNVKEARALIEESGMRMLTADDLQDAAEKAVKVTEILKMAEDAQVGVQFEIPL